MYSFLWSIYQDTTLIQMAKFLFLYPADRLLLKSHHHIRNLHILLILVLGRHLEDDVLLVFRNRLLADMLHQLAHPG